MTPTDYEQDGVAIFFVLILILLLGLIGHAAGFFGHRTTNTPIPTAVPHERLQSALFPLY